MDSTLGFVTFLSAPQGHGQKLIGGTTLCHRVTADTHALGVSGKFVNPAFKL